MRTVIVGLGLIGGSLALDLRESGIASDVAGVDCHPGHAAEATRLGLADQVVTDLDALGGALVEADLVILAIPVDATEKILPRLLDRVSDRATVTDMGSTKLRICQAVESHSRRAQFVASHPMAGTEHSGPSAALRDLFRGKTAVICDAARSGASHVKRIEGLFNGLGMRTVHASAADHDRHVAYVSHLSHIISFVLAETVLAKERDENAIFDLAGGGFESTARLAKSSPAMWEPIFDQNRGNIVSALEGYMQQLEIFHRALASGDRETLRQIMSDANRIRGILSNIRRSG